MAPNSGFAILLRSPWWVSFAIAAVIVLLCGALLPAHLAPFAAVGAVPVAVIGCIAGWRQWRAPSAARVADMHAQLQTWPWRAFADALEAAWRADGHGVERLAAGGAADFVLTKGGQTLLASARRWKAANHGVEPLRELHAAMQARGAQGLVTLTDCPATPSSHIGCVPPFLNFMLGKLAPVAKDL